MSNSLEGRLEVSEAKKGEEGEDFCCGYCGAPTDVDGKELSDFPANHDPDACKWTHGMCCAERIEYEQEMRRVTYEMAADAGMPEIEGELF